MTTDVDEENSTVLSPDDAFATLGNETRMDILQTLGEADGPLAFSELRDRVGVRDSGQFNYHLEKLVGHFIQQTDEGYQLRQPGKRVIEAVFSGALTESPEREPTQIDFSCRFCGAPVEVSYSHERVELYCTECAGAYGAKTRASISQTDHGHIGGMTVPPAGVRGRSAEELFRAASTWAHLEIMAVASDVCPRCSATLDKSVEACENHDSADGLCERCDSRYAVQLHSRCTNCVYEKQGLFAIQLFDTPELLAFGATHGFNVTSDGIEWGWDWDEEVISMDPFKARFTHTIGGDSITLTVDEDLNVVNATKSSISETD